jgi:transcriptional regulator with XRE-family HTH domain
MSNIGNKETFAKNLSYYLSINGRNQKEVAEYLGVAQSTFNEWANAKKYPRIDKIEKLANYFGILKSDLIEEKDGKENAPAEPKLTEGEQILLDLFRRVPENQQQLVLQMIRAALGSQE